MTSLSFIVPTAGRKTLETCLASIAPQLHADDEVIVVADTLCGQLPDSEKIVAGFGTGFRYLEHNAGYSAYGHPQINYGLSQCQGDYIGFNDDDDVWLPDALDEIRLALDSDIAVLPDSILLFRFHSYFNTILWEHIGELVEGRIGGHCIICPNIPGKLGKWTDRYQGDFDFIDSTTSLHGGGQHLIWCNHVIAQARPTEAMRQEIMARYNSTKR